MVSFREREAWALLRSAPVVFWDFDGVIKDSVMAKGDAFEALFAPYGNAVAARVRRHHESHGGISRFQKIPIYLEWAGEVATPGRSSEFCERFGSAVREAVVKSPWVPGVREYLTKYHAEQKFVLVTATPQDEIVDIVKELGINDFFSRIAGAPLAKAQAIAETLMFLGVPATSALLVGDSDADLDAARQTRIGFVLRRTDLNRELEAASGCLAVDDLGGFAE